jgi:hypothetical protein
MVLGMGIAVMTKVTEKQVQDQIVSADYYVFPGSTLTVCALKLRNGFLVTGTSACASEASFSYAIGEHLALQDATRKIWDLEGYLLRSKLAGHVT